MRFNQHDKNWSLESVVYIIDIYLMLVTIKSVMLCELYLTGLLMKQLSATNRIPTECNITLQIMLKRLFEVSAYSEMEIRVSSVDQGWGWCFGNWIIHTYDGLSFVVKTWLSLWVCHSTHLFSH